MFQKNYMMLDRSALDSLFGVCSFYSVFLIEPGYDAYFENHVRTGFPHYIRIASIYRVP